MNWDDIEETIYDGTSEQVSMLKCPDCKGDLRIAYFPEVRSMEIKCKGCGATVRSNGVARTPNFALRSV